MPAGVNNTDPDPTDFEESERRAGGFKKFVKKETKVFGVLGAAIGQQIK